MNKVSMTKQKLINALSQKTGIEKVVVTEIVESTFNVIKQTMINGENVYLRGFGSFIVKRRKGKIGRNITKGLTVIVPERFVPTWKASKSFGDKVKASNKKRL
ncbi:MAG: HU family DNA-binding protein [Bacteroidota bacterium]